MNIVTAPFPELKTNRLLLRRLGMDDRYDLQELRSDDRVNQYLDRAKPTGIKESEDFIRKIDDNLSNNTSLYWAISLKTGRKLIGTICLWNFSAENNTADLGYELSPAYQGQGLMREAAEEVIEYAFKQVGLKAIIALTHPENQKSIGLLQKCDFERDAGYRYVNKDEAGDEAVYFLSEEMFSGKNAANN